MLKSGRTQTAKAIFEDIARNSPQCYRYCYESRAISLSCAGFGNEIVRGLSVVGRVGIMCIRSGIRLVTLPFYCDSNRVMHNLGTVYNACQDIQLAAESFEKCVPYPTLHTLLLQIYLFIPIQFHN